MNRPLAHSIDPAYGTILPPLAEILYRAIESPFGILVKTNDALRARSALDNMKRKLGDPKLVGIQIRQSPIPGGQLIILDLGKRPIP